MTVRYRGAGQAGVAFLLTLLMVCSAALAQTQITPPKNRYTPAQDVEIGRQTADQAEKQLPILRDSQVSNYVERLGQRLVDAVPQQYRHPEFRYYFRVVDARDINAFALPGGPMYINRGMIEAAGSEAEAAGVMAHELSHVVLRHGTAQATKGEKFQLGALAGAIAGAVVGGVVGDIISQGSQFGLGTYFLKYSREYEKQADLLGAQIMARAGYDPLAMAQMFETIERQGGGRGGPQWLSSHPNPGNRREAIRREAQSLRVGDPVRDTRDFQRVQTHLRGMPPARSMEEIARSGSRDRGSYPTDARVGGRVELPSSRYRTDRPSDLFSVSVPANWRQLPSANSVTYAPDGAYGQVRGSNVFTHGVQIGVTRNETHRLEDATYELIQGLAQSNRDLRQATRSRRTDFARREGLVTTLTNVSEVTGRSEVITLYTALLDDGNLFYLVTVAPDPEHRNYQRAFDRVVRSVEVNDRY